MSYEYYQNDLSVLSDFGKEIKQYRIKLNLTQNEFSKKCGISASTLERIENGSDTKFSNIIKILRAFSLLENIDLLIPQSIESFKDIYQNKAERKRASRKSSVPNSDEWVWGEDKGDD